MKHGLFLAFLLASTFGCAPKEISLGVVLPLSGSSASRGEDILNTVVLAIETKNQQGGIHGKKITLHIEDDRDEPERAISIAKRMAETSVIAVLGHYSSSTTQAALPVYIAADLPLVSPSVALSKIPGEGRSFFRNLNTNQEQSLIAAQWIKDAGYEHIAIVHNASAYGKDLAKNLKQRLPESIRGNIFAQTPENEKSILNNLPELIFYAGGYQAAAGYLNPLFDQDISVDWMGGRTLWDYDFVRRLGNERAHTGWVIAPTEDAQTTAFYKTYEARFGRPGPFAYSTYKTLQHMFKALENKPLKFTRKEVKTAFQEHFSKSKPAPPQVLTLDASGTFVPSVQKAALGNLAGDNIALPLKKALKP